MKVKFHLCTLALLLVLAAPLKIWGTLPENYPWCSGTNCGEKELFPLYFLEEMNPEPAVYGELSGEFIYLKPYSDGFDYANMSDTTVLFPFFLFNTDIRPKQANFEWTPGFRLSTGASSEYLDIWTTYTYLRSSNHHTLVSVISPVLGATNEIVGNIWSTTDFTAGDVNELRANYKALYDVVDLDVGKSLYLDRNFYFRPRLGIRGARVEQRMHIRTDITPAPFTDTPVLTEDNIRMVNRFVGIGLKAGADSTYSINSFFSFYANGSFSLLSGSFKVKQEEDFVFFLAESTIGSDGNFTLHALRPSADIHIGLNFGAFIDCAEKARFEGSVGYEFEYWPNQLQWVRSYIDPHGGVAFQQTGDFMLHGLEITAAFYF